MKIALVDMANLKYMPYVKSYLNVIDCSKAEVHIIHWKREASDTTVLDPCIHIHSYEKYIDYSWGWKNKTIEIIKYGRYLRKKIKEISPDFLIVHYQTTAILIYDLLKGKYRNRFILDYRDITYEKKKLFRKAVACIINYSACTFISSEGFRKFLPESGKIHISHNADLNLKYDTLSLKEKLFHKNYPLRIAFWGKIREDKTNLSFIDAVSKSSDFELHYYGKMCEDMRRIIEESDNVFYHGPYTAADRIEFAQNTDLLLNAFDEDDKNMPYAISNKFYDGLFFFIPQICTHNSIMGEKCDQFGIGTKVNIEDPGFLEKVLYYYRNLDAEVFIQNCEHAKTLIMKEINEFAITVDRTLGLTEE